MIEAGVVAPISRFLVEHPGLEARTLRLEWRDGAVVVEATDAAR